MTNWFSQTLTQSALVRPLASLLVVLVTALSPLTAADPQEADYYRMIPFTLPENEVLEVGGFQFLPDGSVALSTRRGEIWIIENPLQDPPEELRWKRFAHGLHEVLGLAYRDGWLYATQRGEVTRLKDTNGDGVADVFETVNDDWMITGDYHEYAFGSKFDRDGNLWVVLCLTGSFGSDAIYRGWCLRITPDGKSIPTVSGIRSPGGIGMNEHGDVFYTDNQGPWNGTCELKWLRPGKFVGHPGGNRWYDLAKDTMGPRPADPKDGSRFHIEAGKIPEYEPPVILFPYGKMGQSASGIACDLSAGKFGPFAGQLFVGDQTHSTIMRVDLEQVDGHYQGACFPFRQGFGSGSLATEFAPDGSLLVGGTNRGWGSRGTKPFAIDRLVWTGEVPFEIQHMRAKPDGFELTFTTPADRESASKPEAYQLGTYTYLFQGNYGSPEVDHTSPTITRVDVAEDGLTARLFIEGLQVGHVHELHADGVRSKDGHPLLHREAYYTLMYRPGQ